LRPSSLNAASLAPADRAREVTGPTPFEEYLAINTARVTDPNVRKAMDVAVDRLAVMQAFDAGTRGTAVQTILPPTTFGWQDYSPFGVGVRGDPATAKAMLGGARPRFTLCHVDAPYGRDEAAVVTRNLAAAGFQVTTRPLDSATYDRTIGQRGNTCDLYRFGIATDFPSGGSMLPVLFDGRQITAEKNLDLSYLNDPAVNQELDRIAAESDMTRAATDWAALDKRIMTEDAPVIPLYDHTGDSVVGADVGGAYFSNAYGVTSLDSVYVKTGPG
jgi:peptide/nickel transport system substrate-binding protein